MLEKINIDATKSTPKITYNDKILIIEGISIPENPYQFYSIVYELLNNYNQDIINININLIYCCSSTSKSMLSLLKKAFQNINNVNVVWYYEIDDFDMYEMGKDIEMILNAKFKFISISN